MSSEEMTFWFMATVIVILGCAFAVTMVLI